MRRSVHDTAGRHRDGRDPESGSACLWRGPLCPLTWTTRPRVDLERGGSVVASARADLFLEIRPGDEPRSPPLPRAVHPVARITEAGDDVAVVVEVAVDGRRPDRHVGVARLEVPDPFRRGQQADEAEILRAARLQEGDGRHRRVAPPAQSGLRSTADLNVPYDRGLTD